MLVSTLKIIAMHDGNRYGKQLLKITCDLGGKY